MIRVYGIAQCDACRKTRKWFADRGIDIEFIDLRKSPVGSGRIERWLDRLGSEKLINRRSTTWRQLDADQRSQAAGSGARDLLVAHPTLIKRPLVERGNALTVGFRPDAWASN